MKILVPDRNTGSCLDPGVPGTGLQRWEREGRGKIEAGPGPLLEREKASWNPAEMEKRWWKAKRNLFDTWCETISSRQSEKIANSFIIILCNKWCINPLFCCVNIDLFQENKLHSATQFALSSFNKQAVHPVSNTSTVETFFFNHVRNNFSCFFIMEPNQTLVRDNI
jgi:hypothetical protein